MGTIVAGGIVIGIAGLAVRSIIRGKKSGKSMQCGGDCANCHGHCR